MHDRSFGGRAGCGGGERGGDGEKEIKRPLKEV